MIIAFAIIALIIISGLSMSIYSIFIPFLQNLATMESYNTAYYGAITASERALLVTRQQGFGFDGSGGREGTINRGPSSDGKTTDMGTLSEDENGIFRSIQGSTNRIPQTSQGNIPMIFAGSDSEDYNTFTHAQTTIIQTETNQNTNPNTFYDPNGKIIGSFTGTEITTHRRIPPKIQEYLGGGINTFLCDQNNNTICDDNHDNIFNDIMIARQWQGDINGESFTIIPTTQTFEINGNVEVDPQRDNHIREDIINNNQGIPTIPIVRFGNSMSPIVKTPSILTTHEVLGSGGNQVNNLPFQSLFNNGNITNLTLRYDMIQKPVNTDGYMYPFLEQYIAADQNISDTDRHISGQGRAGQYKINIQIQKPQKTSNQGGNFTIVF